jgi:DNA invertase Pin-like site-specific DNA recombinase
MKQKRIVIYGRVSTVEQRHDSQIDEVREYCRRRFDESADLTLITDVASGAKTSREGLDRMMKLVRRGKVDVVACFKLDRLGRSLNHLAQVIAELDQHGVALVATSQGIDTNHDSPAGRLQMHVLCAVAEFERTLIVERVRAGQAAARARGVRFGRPATLSQHRACVTALLESGLSCREVAMQTELPLGSVFNISRTLRQHRNGAPAVNNKAEPTECQT